MAGIYFVLPLLLLISTQIQSRLLIHNICKKNTELNLRRKHMSGLKKLLSVNQDSGNDPTVVNILYSDI